MVGIIAHVEGSKFCSIAFQKMIPEILEPFRYMQFPKVFFFFYLDVWKYLPLDSCVNSS